MGETSPTRLPGTPEDERGRAAEQQNARTRYIVTTRSGVTPN
jgi:hypothetical protein